MKLHHRIARVRQRQKRRATQFRPAVETLERRELMALAPPALLNISRFASAPDFDFRIVGTAEPHAQITVQQVGGGIVGATEANSQGAWSLVHSDARLADGGFKYVARAEVGGEVSPLSAQSLFQPNLVLIQLDDARADDIQFMPFVSQQLATQGTQFVNSFTTTALSGPSRASLMTGLYAHHTGVLANVEPLGGNVNRDDSSTLAVWLDEAGYRTGWFGKRCDNTNPNLESDPGVVPVAGWDQFYVRRNGDGYYDWQESQNGVIVSFGSAPEDYSTDVWRRQAQSFLRAGDSNVAPTFLYFAPYAGHSPFHPAPRHEGTLNDLAPNRPPSFNVPPADLNRAPLSLDEIARNDLIRQRHVETLLAADEAIEQLFNTLAGTGELDNTVIVFTTDHGFMFGEHAVSLRKQDYYEESMRVPLIVWDGRAPAARVNESLVANIDLAPTLVELAGADLPGAVDGRSLVAAIHGDLAPVRDAILFENWWGGEQSPWLSEGQGNQATGVRTARWKYAEHDNGYVALFDLQNDPHEMVNRAGDRALSAVQAQLARRLDQLRSPDRQGPVIRDVESSIERDGRGHFFIRLTGEVDDAPTGGSDAKSPAFSLDSFNFRNNGLDKTIDAVDGKFDSTSELFRGGVYPRHLADITTGGEHTILIRGRDTAGNWGPAARVPLFLATPPRLIPASDTGQSAVDGVTADATPTFTGAGQPGAMVKLIDAKGRFPVPLGTTTVNADGNWSITLNLATGSYRVMAIVSDSNGVRFSAAKALHVAASFDTLGNLTVAGTSGDDVILVDAAASTTSLFINGVLVDRFSGVTRITCNAQAGNDTVTILGNVPAFLFGSAGDDVLIGGSNDDLFDGGLGRNVLRGGPGNDVYRAPGVVPGRLEPSIHVSDEVWELPGEGIDTLDFSHVSDPITFNTESGTLARYDARSPILWRREMKLLGGENASVERLRLGPGPATITAHPSLQVEDAEGNTTIQSSANVEPGASLPLPIIAIGSKLAAQKYRLVLQTTLGTLRVFTNVPGGVEQAQVAGNGANRVTIIASDSQLRRTLDSSGLIFQAPAASSGKAFIAARLFSGTRLIERDDLVIPVSVAPRLGLSSSSRTFSEGSAPVLLFPGASLSASPSQLVGARLVVVFQPERDPADQLRILRQGLAEGQIDVAAKVVLFSGQVVGRILSNGVQGGPLDILFNSTATPAAVEALVRSIAFVNTSDAPSAANRVIAVRLFDKLGSANPSPAFTVRVTPSNDPPRLQLKAGVPHAQGRAPVVLSPAALLIDPDSAGFAKGRLTVGMASGAEAGERLSIRHQGMLPNQVGTRENRVYFSGVLVGTRSGGGSAPLRIVLNQNASLNAVRAILRSITYVRLGAIPDPRIREVAFTLSERDGTTSDPALVRVHLLPE